tara:strand:+ start:150 stop:398 length:249 start_codon:yes stop_codon:yes gene_type:complete
MIIRIINNILICLIKLYQFTISPFLNSKCRYLPTCSEFAIEAITLHGPLKGIYFSLKRIFRCHPLGGSGYDPVPKKIQKGIN